MNEPLLNTLIPIEAKMGAILATAFAILIGLHSLQLPIVPPQHDKQKQQQHHHHHQQQQQEPSLSTTISIYKNHTITLPLLLPNPNTEPSKYCYEIFAWRYTALWISIFGFIVVSQCYEYFTAWGYLGVCGGLALPLMLQPMVYPQASTPSVSVNIGENRNGNYGKLEEEEVVFVVNNPDTNRPFHKRYSTKATLYLLVYSFIGNYWYTHYFYSVLQAKYTMPSHRLNDVPIAMFLATHFYFCTYHVCISNGLLRYVDRMYQNDQKGGWWRKKVLFWYTVAFLSYFTAFMETLTISSFPYYSFEDRVMAYVWGSAFYGVYFVVSFPGFYYFDVHVDDDDDDDDDGEGIVVEKEEKGKNGLDVGDGGGDRGQRRGRRVTLVDTLTIACGHGMMILTLLDFVRLYLGVPLVIGGIAFATTA